ncbi:MAG: hypothetical protein AABZ39_04210 [Spirochaetota bacterium]
MWCDISIRQQYTVRMKYIIALLAAATAFPSALCPLVVSNCSTRYPIILVHGVSARDDDAAVAYWGRIPGRLRTEGALVFFSGQDAWRSHAGNAMIIKRSISSAMQAAGTAKVNLIAMSKGGIESRYAITHLGMAPYVASLTTIATPHCGSSVADFALEQYRTFGTAAALTFSLAGALSGDKDPDVREAAVELSIPYMKEFNRTCPDSPLVYYQSHAFVMKRPECNLLLAFQHAIILAREGANDGLVSTASAQWGTFRGIIEGELNGTGVSHFHAHDGFRNNVSGFDTPAFYVSVVRELKVHGF